MASLIDELSYIVFDTVDIEAWRRFASDVLGFEVAGDAATLRLRMDGRPFRCLVQQGETESLPIVGWRISDASTLKILLSRLSDADMCVEDLDASDLATRQVDGGIRFRCHNGIQHEIVYGPAQCESFTPMGDVSGFITSLGGMGHVVWSTPDMEQMDRLMLDIFAMTLREDISTPAGQGHFYGCNPRHHSMAVFSAPVLSLQHIMVEMNEIDDVGRAMDRVSDLEYEMLQPLGRHRTDHMLSFYVKTPNGFGMEIGCGGVLCDDNWSEVRSANRRRPWGHGAAMHTHRKKFPAPAAAGNGG